jgi:fatty acid desaturase
VNYKTGTNHLDFLHGWLNYQIEHHLFPNLPLNHYQRMQPRVKAVCEKHNLPYRQEGVFKRLRMTLALMVGKTNLLVIEHA